MRASARCDLVVGGVTVEDAVELKAAVHPFDKTNTSVHIRPDNDIQECTLRTWYASWSRYGLCVHRMDSGERANEEAAERY